MTPNSHIARKAVRHLPFIGLRHVRAHAPGREVGYGRERLARVFGERRAPVTTTARTFKTWAKDKLLTEVKVLRDGYGDKFHGIHLIACPFYVA